jgi:hypothetical protein
MGLGCVKPREVHDLDQAPERIGMKVSLVCGGFEVPEVSLNPPPSYAGKEQLARQP